MASILLHRLESFLLWLMGGVWVNKKVMEEMGESYKDKTDFSMAVDMKKMAYGGFEVAVEG